MEAEWLLSGRMDFLHQQERLDKLILDFFPQLYNANFLWQYKGTSLILESLGLTDPPRSPYKQLFYILLASAEYQAKYLKVTSKLSEICF